MSEPITGTKLAQHVAELQAGAGEIAIWWLGQSSFVLRAHDGRTFMIDPYFPTDRPSDTFIHPQPPLEGPDLSVDFVFCTHDHLDHTHPEYLLSLAQKHSSPTLFLTADGTKRMGESGVARNRMRTLSAGETVDLGAVRVSVLRSKTPEVADTDHFAYVFHFGAGKVLHTGDIMRGVTSVPELMEPLIAQRPQVALLTMTPDEGGEFPSFEEGAALARAINAKVAIPSHYDCFVRRDYDPTVFAAQFGPQDAARPVIIQYCGYHIFRA